MPWTSICMSLDEPLWAYKTNLHPDLIRAGTDILQRATFSALKLRARCLSSLRQPCILLGGDVAEHAPACHASAWVRTQIRSKLTHDFLIISSLLTPPTASQMRLLYSQQSSTHGACCKILERFPRMSIRFRIQR